jgi:hypothetical protein
MHAQPRLYAVEVAAEFLKEVGAFLGDTTPAGLFAVMDRLRGILREGTNIDKRTAFIIEQLFAVCVCGCVGGVGVGGEKGGRVETCVLPWGRRVPLPLPTVFFLSFFFSFSYSLRWVWG